MGNFTMGATLLLKDQASPIFGRVKSATNSFKTAMMSTSKAASSWNSTQTKLKSSLTGYASSAKKAETSTNSYGNALTKLTQKASAASIAIKAVFAGAVVKKGYDWLVGGNASMEQYQNTLSVVLGSQEKAVEQLAWAQKFAAKTPFEIPEIVEATTRMQSYGIQAKDTLGIVGDMASVMGKPLMQAVEAVADAQTGEMERLKEFGIN